MHGYRRIRKYLLILAVFFIGLLVCHLGVLYVYTDAKIIPQEWGTVSIGIIDNTPSINPAKYGENPSGDLVMRFLYRSLLRYNNTTKQMEGDITNCDLGVNFLKMKCFLKPDLKWSNGNIISKEDILASYYYYKNTSTNDYVKGLLKNIEVQDAGDYIEFSSKNADVLLLDTLTLPILPAAQIGNIVQKNTPITPSSLIVSGPFKVEKEDTAVSGTGTKISLVKNSFFTERPLYIKKYVFRFFTSATTLLKNEDVLNGILFHSNDLGQAPSSPRFEKYQFLYPQYISLFLNSSSIHQEMRKIILQALNQASYPELDKELWALIQDPFLGNKPISNEKPTQTLDTILGNLGYYKKWMLISHIQTKQANTATTKKEAQYNHYFTSPSKLLTTAVLAKDEIFLSGLVPAGVEAVYVNNFRLTSFVPGNPKFYFRASRNFKTLTDGKNTYTLHFLINKKKIYKESITVFNEKDPASYDIRMKAITAELSAGPATDPKKTAAEIAALKTKIETLDDVYYYDTNLNRFSLSLFYTKTSSVFENLAAKIEKELKFLGIAVIKKEVSESQLGNVINNEEKNYDMILLGVNNGLFDYNVAPFFHSSQIKQGYNFSKIKNPQLDNLLETLKSGKLETDKLTYLKTQINTILAKEAVVKTFYSPYNNFFIDRNIRNLEKDTIIPSKSYLYNVLEPSYIKITRITISQGKGFFSFLNWLTHL